MGDKDSPSHSGSVATTSAGYRYPAAPDNAATLSPQEARNLFRSNRSTTGFCAGYLQACITVLSKELAGDFSEYCRQNYATLPLLFQSQPGEVDTPLATTESDIR